MTSEQMFDLLLLAIGIVAAMVSAVLYRVWTIPAMQQKLEGLEVQANKTTKNLNDVKNTLHTHDIRLTILEESDTPKGKP